MEKKQGRKTHEKKRRAAMAVLLSFFLLFQSGMAFTANATVSKNGLAGEEAAATVSKNQPAENEPDETGEIEADTEPDEGSGKNPNDVEADGLEEEEDAMESTVSGQDIPEIQTGSAAGPANPVHHCTKKNDGSDHTDFDYVYFGSYPQSEVRDRGTMAAIDKAIGASGIAAEAGTDVWVNGTKYRRICKRDIKNDRNFYKASNNNGYRYFKWERMKWKVLQNNGTTLFVVADRAIDCKDYNEERVHITWETSTIRNWLNTSFYNTAFSSRERGAIAAQTIVKDNPSYGTAGGSNTEDNVFLLSIGEVTNEQYGFCEDDSTESASRREKASDYVYVKGALMRDNHNKYIESCLWWLRLTDYPSVRAPIVTSLGKIMWSGHLVDDDYFTAGICPALHINLSSALWSAADDGTSGDGGEEKIPAALQAIKGKTVYSIGESLNVDDLKVKVSYKRHSTEELRAGEYTTNASQINMATPGKKTLTVSYTYGGTTYQASVPITVEGITKLSVTGPSKKLAAGKKVKLTLVSAPKEAPAGAVEWKSSNKKYAAVDNNGTVTIKKAGAGRNVTITATVRGDSRVKATYRFQIMKHAVKSIKLKVPGKTLKTGKSMTVKATVKTTGRNANKTLNWTSSNKKYATVNSKGKVTAKKAGKGKTVTITAKSTDGSGKKAAVKLKIK